MTTLSMAGVSYFSIPFVTSLRLCLVQLLRYSASNNGMTLKPGQVRSRSRSLKIRRSIDLGYYWSATELTFKSQSMSLTMTPFEIYI